MIQYISNISIENIDHAVGFNGGFIKACHIIHHYIHCVLLKLVLTELMNETDNDANCMFIIHRGEMPL